MSDDVFEAFGGDDIFNDDEEPKRAEGEGQNNRTFIIAVAALGGLLVCAIGAFMVWALVLNKPQQVAQAPTEVVVTEEPPTATVAVIVETDTPEPTATRPPTNTPAPSPTPLLGPTSTPAPDSDTVAEASGENAQPTPTQVVRRTPTPTPQPVARASGSGTQSGDTPSGTAASTELAQTGLGEWVLIGAAVFLLATMVLARKLRSA